MRSENHFFNLLPEPIKTDLSYYQEEPLNIAVIGFGKMGIAHATILNLLHKGAVKHIVDRSDLIRIGGRILLKNINFWKDAEKLLNRTDIDAFYVTTPTQSHFPISKELLESGARGIFIEKPPTINSYETEILAELAKKSVDMVGLMRRYSLTFREAKKWLDTALKNKHINSIKAYIKYGSISTMTKPKRRKVTRGVLLDMGIYLLDLLVWYFGDLQVVNAKYKSLSGGTDDIFYAELATSKGHPVYIEADWTDPNYRFPEAKIEIKGDDFLLEVSDDSLILKLEGETWKRRKPEYYAGFPPVNLAYPEYVIENMHFLTCLRMQTKTETSLIYAVKLMQTIDQLYETAQPW
jgi:predicted dehydrogenase